MGIAWSRSDQPSSMQTLALTAAAAAIAGAATYHCVLSMQNTSCKQVQQQNSKQGPEQTVSHSTTSVDKQRNGKALANGQSIQTSGAPEPSSSSNKQQQKEQLFTARPIGYLRSCFTTRNGTPRQPLLVPAARSRLVLHSDIPDSSFEGMEEWSHVWIIYIFHENTEPKDGVRTTQHKLKGKIHVPRLNGEKVGLFATRTPHRPVPIGLSVAQIISVDVAKRTIVLGGADIVDGSPILDIKPYAPFCDSLPEARTPQYVRLEDAEEPLAVAQVVMTRAGRQLLASCWKRNANRTLYATADEYIEFVCQVLSRDIRALRQRLHQGPAAQQRNQASLESAAALLASKVELLPPPSTLSTTPVAVSTAQIARDVSATSQANQSDSSPLQAVNGLHKTVSEGSIQPKSNPNDQETVVGSSSRAADKRATDASQSNSEADLQGSITSKYTQHKDEELQGTGVFHVVLEGVDVSYDVDASGLIIIGGASITTDLAKQHAHKHLS